MEKCDIMEEKLKTYEIPHPRSPDFIDYTGRKIGYVKVIGYGGRQGKKGAATWVCQCLCCGQYEKRRTASLKRYNDTYDNSCSICYNDHVMKYKNFLTSLKS